VKCPTLEQELDHQAADKRDASFVVSPFEEDHARMGHVCDESNWTVNGVRTCREATVLMRENPPPVVICERDLPDGNWKDILDDLILLAPSGWKYSISAVTMCSPSLVPKKKCGGRWTRHGDTGTASGNGPSFGRP